MGTPLCIPSQDFIDIGRVASIENNHKPVDTAKKGQQVAIKVLIISFIFSVRLGGIQCSGFRRIYAFLYALQIVGSNPEEQQKMYGRHFDIDDELVSHISRKSIDVLKANYRVTITYIRCLIVSVVQQVDVL